MNFEPNKDFVYYEAMNDLIYKIDYYLKHDDERYKKLNNGYAKVKKACYEIKINAYIRYHSYSS